MKTIHCLCAVLLCVLPLVAGACTNPTATPAPAPTDAPAPSPTDIPKQTDAPAPTPLPTDAPAPTAMPEADIVLITPEAATVDAVLAGLKGSQLPPRDHVPPYPAGLAGLAEIYLALSGQETLVNPCAGSCAAFNTARATTYSLPDAGAEIGALYQLVSLQEPFDGPLADSKAWGERGLVVGGLLVAQPNPLALPKIDKLPPGPYLVVLRRSGADLTAELWNDPGAGEPYTTVPWRLRQRQGLTQTAGAPFSFVSIDELCFSQVEFQACLVARTPTVGAAQNLAAIEKAVAALKDANLLPADAAVRTDAAMPGIQGRDTIGKCYEIISATPTDCLADTVTAGMDALVEQTNLPGGGVSDLIAGIGVLAVLTDLPDEVFDGDGEPVTLAAGSYRLDLVRTTAPDAPWLAQFVQAGSLKTFYLYAVSVYARGIPVDPDPDEKLMFKPIADLPFSSEVLLDDYFYSICQRALDTGLDCRNPNKWLRDWCITAWTPGWCDEVGYGVE